MRRARGDEGSLSLMVAVLGAAFLLLVGLVIDSARVLNARGQASAYADSAARAGAGAIDPSSDPVQLVLLPGTGLQTVDERVLAYCCSTIDKGKDNCLQNGPFDDCQAMCEDAAQVVVQTKMVVKTSFLGLVGINEITVKGTGRARPVVGVQSGEPLRADECRPGG